MSTKVMRQSEMSVLEELHLPGALLEDEVVGPGLVVVEEKVLDRRRAVAEAEHEVGMPVVGVVAHDVPEQRTLPDERHRLGAGGDAVTHPHPEATAEQDNFHRLLLVSDDLELRDRKDQSPAP